MFHEPIEAPRAARFDINIRLATLLDTSNILIPQPSKASIYWKLSSCLLFSCSKLQVYQQLELLKKAQLIRLQPP